MFDNSRSIWLPKNEPFNGPAFEPDRIQQIIIHYIGTAKAPSNSSSWMLNEHRRTMRLNKPYSFMYNAHVALNGSTWEGRGVQFRNAANGGATNPTTWSIVFAVNGQDAASEAQIAGARKLVNGIRSFLGRDVPVIAHRDIASTQCPGEGITAQIAAGLFERSTNIMRISGANRYDTSALISRQVYPQGAKVVYIASGTKFPDALSASMFKDGPLLLTDPDRLSPETAAEITRLKVDRVVIIGGPLGISNQVEQQIAALFS
jgi:hypothetical protein